MSPSPPEPQKAKEGLSIIVPVFNEARSIEGVIRRLLQVIAGLERPAELIVVDDGSVDGTADILHNFASQVKVIRHSENRGYGAALKTGIRRCSHPLAVIVDADGTYPVRDLPRLLAECPPHAMIVGARRGNHFHRPFVRGLTRWFLSRLAAFMAETRIPDLNSGFRLFRTAVVQDYLRILPNRFSFTSTLTLAMISDGHSVKFLPIDYYARKGRSKLRAPDALGFLVLIIRTITYFNPLRFFLPFALGLLALAAGRLCYDIFWLRNLTDSTTLLFLASFQVGLLGIVADLVVRKSRD